MKKIIYLSLILALTAAVFFSCDIAVALGERLNLKPPIVEILTPSFMENIKEDLVITGTAKDEKEIVVLYISIERVSRSGNEWKVDYRAESGAWKKWDSAAQSWVDTNDGKWIQEGGPETVKWSVTLSTLGSDDGEFLITVGAENNVFNKGPQEQRRVIIDNSGPVTNILSPILEENTVVALPIFETYALEDPSIMDRLFNQDIKIQYEIDDDFSIDTIVFELYDTEGIIVLPGSEIEASWGGRYEFKEHEIVFAAQNFLGNAPYYLQLISRAKDKAGNSKITNHGCFVYWPDSDLPWASGIGYEDTDEANIQENRIYPESEMQLLSYDDDGVELVMYQIFKVNSDDSQGDAVTQIIVKENLPPSFLQGAVSNFSPSTFFSFPVLAPSAPGMYQINITCQDVNGLLSKEKIRYFFVPDYSIPEIIINFPDKDESLFGNASGTFTISGSVSDGAGPKELYVAWIKPGVTTGENTSARNQFEYQSAESAVWDDAPAGTGVFTDANGNKIWKLDLSTAVIANGKATKTFTRNLNLFTDLGINATDVALITQTFVFMAVGSNDTPVTKLHSVRGDITPPDLSITNIAISGSQTANFPVSYFDDTNNSMPNLEAGDTITITGTWDDDSFTVWGGTNNAAIRRREFTVKWNDIILSNAALNPNKTWSASIPLDADQASLGGGRIEVTLNDYGKNIATASLSAKADTNIPVLMSITSDSPDGSYRAGQVINIYLDFNKPVKCTNTSGLTLTLREKGDSSGDFATAQYSTASGNNNTTGSARHTFTYTVGSSDNFNILNVNIINTTATNWQDATNSYMRPNVTVGAVSGRNLGDTKALRIDTKAPGLLNVHALTDSGYYKLNQTIYLIMTFDEEINFAPASTNNTVLGLNVGAGTGAGRLPMSMGSDQLLFTYQIQANDNTPAAAFLTANGFTIGGGTIKDIAGNDFTYSTMPSANINTDKQIVIDTAKPAQPSLTGSIASGTSSPNPQTFTVAAVGETDAPVLEYSINGGPWLVYSDPYRDPPVAGSPVTISSTAEYSIRARQTDRAGNESDPTAPYSMQITRSESLLQSIGGSLPGTYTTGDTIQIRLNLANRGPFAVASGTPTLGLNITNFAGVSTNRTAAFSAVDGNSLVFTYTIVAGDTAEMLEITSLNLTGTNITGEGNSLNTELLADWDRPGRQPLSFYTRITIKTDTPAVQSIALNTDGTELTITFTKDVWKGTGNIVITQPTTAGNNQYRAPAVMSKADYARWGADAVLKPYYELGTNGTNNTGAPDTVERYILKYDIEPTDTALVAALTGRNAHIVTIPVASGAVTINNANRRVMTVQLTENWGNTLRVKGVTYNLVLDNTIINDELSKPLAANYTNTIANPGVNDPVIRVQKNRGAFSLRDVSLSTTGTVTKTYWVNTAAAEIRTVAEGAGTTGTWVRVNQYYASGTYTSQSTAPTTAQTPSKWWQTDPVNTNYWIKNAALTFSAAEPTTAGNWASVAQFYTSFPINTPGVTVGATSGAYLAAGTGTAATYRLDANNINTGGRGQVRGNGYRNANSTSFLISDYLGDNAWTNVNMNFWINPYETTNTLGNRYNQGDVIVNNNVLWANVASIANTTTDMVPASNPPANTNAGWLRVAVSERTYIDLRTVRWSTATTGIQIPRYWIRIDNVTTTETDMSGTAGWVSYSVEETTGGTPTAVTTQPHNAEVRIDSQTPSAQIRYRIVRTERTPQTGTAGTPFNGTTNPSAPAFPTVAAPDTAVFANGVKITEVLSTAQQATYNGYVVGIRAVAVRNPGTNESTSGTVYNKATRSVIQFNFDPDVPNNWNTLRNTAAGNGRLLQLWLRGGDNQSGENSAQGFPLSWDEKDLSGARLMTNLSLGGTAAAHWYWITWEITDRAYFYFIAGTTNGNLADISENGPINWAWGKNNWAVQQSQYPLHSGGSLSFTRGTRVANPATENFEFYDAFSGNRTAVPAP